MRLKFLIVFFLTKSILINGQVSMDLTKYVNPLVGTDSKKELSNGNTYPAIAMPWGCLLYTSPSPRDRQKSRMPSSA